MALAFRSDESIAASTGAPVDDPFMAAVRSLREACGDGLSRVDDTIIGALQSPVEMIPAVAGHLVKAGGKRLRPLLTLAAADLFGYRGDNHVRLAAAVELIHGATLLHDDVVDDSALRRGESTANVIWGNKESVLVGDFIFSRSFELMVAAGDLDVLQVLSRAAGVIAEGEVLQLGTQKNVETTFATYLAVVEAKTAELFAAAAHVGAMTAGAAPDAVDAMRRYGLNLGVAFQLIDDALDSAGRQAAIGKTVGDDFREGKMTAPVVFALAEADEAEMTFWRRTIGAGDQSDADLADAIRIIDSTGAFDRTIREADLYVQGALEALEQAPPGSMRDRLASIAQESTRRGR